MKPIDVKRCYQLFYEVAKVCLSIVTSPDFCQPEPFPHSNRGKFTIFLLRGPSPQRWSNSSNSAMNLASTPQNSMVWWTWILDDWRRRNLPINLFSFISVRCFSHFLRNYMRAWRYSLGDVLPTTVLATNIVNASGIHWRQSQELHLELQGFVSHSDCQLLSPQQYSFSGDQILGFVKNDLIEFEPVVDMPNKIQSILKQYKKATRTGIFVPKTRR